MSATDVVISRARREPWIGSGRVDWNQDGLDLQAVQATILRVKCFHVCLHRILE